MNLKVLTLSGHNKSSKQSEQNFLRLNDFYKWIHDNGDRQQIVVLFLHARTLQVFRFLSMASPEGFDWMKG